MNCSMCGARIPEGRASCVQCGAPVGRAPGTILPAPVPSYGGSIDVPRVCPRCGNAGVSISYFANGFHILALVALTLFSGGILGVAYLFFRAGYRICPTCSQTWGRGGHMAPALAGGGARAGVTEEVSITDGRGKRGFAYALWVFATMMMMGGIGEGEPAMMMIALMAAAAGFFLFRSGNEDRRMRREALIQKLQLPVLQLAGEMGGQLTVTQVAGRLGWSLPRAEKVLQSLEDGYRVMGDVTDQGVIVYNFLELVNAPPKAMALPHPGQAGDDNTRLMA
jgi:hypothetical protein